MTVCWKAWKNDKTVFPPFPQTLEIASQRFPHSHRRDDYGMNISQTFNVPGVGQNKMPKWAKPACQTQGAVEYPTSLNISRRVAPGVLMGLASYSSVRLVVFDASSTRRLLKTIDA